MALSLDANQLQVAPLCAVTFQLSGTNRHVALDGWQGKASYLMIWSTGGQEVYLSTMNIPGGGVAGDERPVTGPCSVYVGHYTAISIRTNAEFSDTAVTLEFTPAPVTPTRDQAEPLLAPGRCGA